MNNMERTFQIPYQTTGFFSPLFLDYVQQKEQLQSFYKYAPTLSEFSTIIADKKKESLNRTVLTTVLKEQYASQSTSDLVKQNIEALLDANTFTVTTGHQLGLFTGELYFIYKIITTINLAKEVELLNPGTKIVPVFWMATEDHDFEEINHANVERVTFSWNKETKGATGRIKVKEVQKIIESLDHFLADRPGKKELIDLFTNAYQSNFSLAEATQCLVNDLFKNDGLVILDADHPLLKKEFATIIKDDILHQNSFRETNKNTTLLSKNYSAQVNPREINFFYLRDEFRERIINKGNNYETVNGDNQFTETELINEIETHPEYFSPNVIMRPVYQEKILPNLAYIGGPGELAYWLQLKAVFEHYTINFPMLVWRNSFMLLEVEDLNKIKKHLPDVFSIFQSTEILINDYTRRNAISTLELTQEKENIATEITSIEQKLIAIDPTLVPSLKGVLIRLERMLVNLEHKMLKAEKKKHQIAIQQITSLKESLFPFQSLQERKENFSVWYANHPKTFITTIKANSKPLSQDFSIVVLEK